MRLFTALVVVLLLTAPAVALPQPAASSDAPVLAPGADDAAARTLVAALPRATHVNDADGNKVFDNLESRFLEALPGARLSVIVLGVQGTDPHGLLDDARETVGRTFPADRVFTIVPAFVAELSHAEVLRVAGLRDVRQVEWNAPGEPELATSTVASGVRAVQRGLNVTGDLDGNTAAFTADDVAIAVLDTGIDGEHVDFADGKIIHFEDVGDGKHGTAYDGGSHGTHVASIAAGLGGGDPDREGVAPGAALVGVKITSEDLSKSTMDNAIAAVEWVVENKDAHGIRILTLSFGFGTATDGTTALELAMDAAWDAGVVTFKSTGNSGPERGTVTVPGAARGIIGVGAMKDPSEQMGSATGTPVDAFNYAAGFQLAAFSSRGPTTDGRVKPDLAAPGVAISAAAEGSGDGYRRASGTSMAAPFAAGTAALVLAANPALDPDGVRDVLKSTTEDWGLEGPDVDYGWGRLDALAAVAKAMSLAEVPVADVAPPVIPRHESRAGTLDAAGHGTETVTVEEGGRPVALTFIVEGRGLDVLVTDPDGVPVTDGVRDVYGKGMRQLSRAFNATSAGTYTVHLVGTSLAAYTLDVAHDAWVAPSLVDVIAGDVLEGAADEPVRAVPAPGVLAAFVVALALAAFRRRR